MFLWPVSEVIGLKSLLKSVLTGKDAFDISSKLLKPRFLSVSFDKFELLILNVLKKFVKLGYLSLLV